MGALMITCPNTGQPISTGIETDEYSLKTDRRCSHTDPLPFLRARSYVVEARGVADRPTRTTVAPIYRRPEAG
jgi:hypothetical protein